MRKWLTDMRIKAGLTQAQVAKGANISQPSYNAIENGRSTPKPDTAKRIGNLLHFPWPKFYEEDDDDE